MFPSQVETPSRENCLYWAYCSITVATTLAAPRAQQISYFFFFFFDPSQSFWYSALYIGAPRNAFSEHSSDSPSFLVPIWKLSYNDGCLRLIRHIFTTNPEKTKKKFEKSIKPRRKEENIKNSIKNFIATNQKKKSENWKTKGSSNIKSTQNTVKVPHWKFIVSIHFINLFKGSIR